MFRKVLNYILSVILGINGIFLLVDCCQYKDFDKFLIIMSLGLLCIKSAIKDLEE